MDKTFFTDQAMRCERSLYRVAASYLRNEADAADAVQSALARAWEKRHTLREERFFATWLTRILINECKGQLRRSRRRAPCWTDLPESGGAPPPGADLEMREMLFSLPVRQRTALTLSVLDGYSSREIARMMGQPESTVRSQVARARKKLKAEWLEEANNAYETP